MAAKLEKERALLEERTRGEEERRRKEQEAKEAAAAAVQTPAAAPVSAPVPAAVPQAPVQAVLQAPPAPPSTPGVLETVCSQANQAWHTQVLSFKADYVKDVTFSEAEKPYKFNLQKAVNTPLNSLSGVSSAHMQDKVDKLVQLLSGATVTVADKTISTSSHPHGQKFCLALAAKKLAKQGEEVVSSDPKSAFPAATLALALWDRYPDFGPLLLGYMFECCPFLVPLHPSRVEGSSDSEYYSALGYRYEGGEVEKQDKYLKRMCGVARLYAALAVCHLPKASPNSLHPHSLQRLWQWLASISNLTPHTDVSASLLLQVLEVAGHRLLATYGRQFTKLLQLFLTQYSPLLEAVKSEGGPTVRLEQFLSMAMKQGAIKEPEGVLRPGFI